VQEQHRATESEINALQRAYNSDMSVAFRALEENLIGRAQDIVRRHVPEPGEPDFRGWEWRYAWAQSRSDAVHTWNTPADMGIINAIRISPDQQHLVSCERRSVKSGVHRNRRLWNIQTRQELKRVLLPGGSDRGLAFSNAGDFLALHHLVDVNNRNEVHIYETSTWQLKTVIPSETLIHSLSFSTDDKTLAAVGNSGAVLWDWDEERDEERTVWKGLIPKQGGFHRDRNHDLAFFPDGRHLAIAAHGELTIVDLVTYDIVHQQPAPGEGAPIAISPDSRYVVMGSGDGHGEIGVLNTGLPNPASWKPEPPLIGHGDWVSSLAFTADGKRLISSSADNTLRVWDMNRRVTTRVLKGHQSHVYSFVLAADEERIISAGWDEQILEWDLTARQSRPREHQLAEPVREVVFSADSRRFYTLGKNGLVCIWDAKAFMKQHSLSPELGKNSSLLLSPDGDHLIAGTGSGELFVWDTETRKVIAQRKAQSRQIIPVGFSSDGTSLVTLGFENRISLWNAKTWQLRSSAQSGLDIAYYSHVVAEIPPKSDILLYPSGKDLIWWDLLQSRKFDQARVHPRWSGYIAVSPTGSLLASACGDSFIFLWDWQTRQSVGRLRAPRGTSSVAFSPDGRRLISGGSIQEAITLWDVSNQQEIAQFGTSSTLVVRVQFSPDLNTICAVDNRGIAYFWCAPSFEEINDLEGQQHQIERR
jgi:WD40 repeat protein